MSEMSSSPSTMEMMMESGPQVGNITVLIRIAAVDNPPVLVSRGELYILGYIWRQWGWRRHILRCIET